MSTEERMELERIRRELRRYKMRTTICTPSFILSRRSPGVSIFLGWVIFILFVTIVIFMFMAIIKIFGAHEIPRIARTLLIGVIAMGIFLLMVSLFIVDALTSQEEKQTQMLETLKRIEEHAYNQYQLSGKLLRRSK